MLDQFIIISKCIHRSVNIPLSPSYPGIAICSPLCVRPPSTTRYVTLGLLVDVGEEGVKVEGEAVVNRHSQSISQPLTTRQ